MFKTGEQKRRANLARNSLEMKDMLGRNLAKSEPALPTYAEEREKKHTQRKSILKKVSKVTFATSKKKDKK